MTRDPDTYDLFVSYARANNGDLWVKRFVEELQAEHKRFTGGRELTYFWDDERIPTFSHFQTEVFNNGIARSRLFLAFVSPEYFASEVCRREWKAWIDQEIAKHILCDGATPIYIVEVPGFLSKPPMDEHEVAREVARLCDVSTQERFESSAASLVKEFRRRQLEVVLPFYQVGVDALRQADLKQVLERLAREIDERSQLVRQAAESENTVPNYNRNFTGRLEELLELRSRLANDRTGVICGIHGLGGIGKTELAYTYAHAFAGAYPGGRFIVRCERESELLWALIRMERDPFHDEIREEDRMNPRAHFAAIQRALQRRIDEKGPVLLILDNVTDRNLLTRQELDGLTVLGPQLHLLATTREPPPADDRNWLKLGELTPDDAYDLLDKFRPIKTDADRSAAREIVRKLGGFALAVELVAAGLRAHPSATYAGVAEGLGLDDLDTLAEDRDVELRQHNHEKRLQAVLGPTLAALTPEQRRVLDLSAFLPPDHVPLPWLRELALAEFPELAQPGKWGDPWQALVRELERRALIMRVNDVVLGERLVRVHRLVQDLLRAELSTGDLEEISHRVLAQVRARNEALESTTNWLEARWELEPLTALAQLWDETGHDQAASLANQAAFYWHRLAEWTRAEPLMRRVVDILENPGGEPFSNYSGALNNFAQLLKATNRLAEAEPLMRRALAIDEASFGPEHPDVARDLNNLAHLLQATNRLAEAEPLYRRALAIDEASFGPEHPHIARDLNNLASLLQATNRLAEAEPLRRRVVDILENPGGEPFSNYSGALNNFAQLLKATNRLAEAEPLMRRALAIDEASFGPEIPKSPPTSTTWAKLLQATNRLAEAEPLYQASAGD
ncbi:MAG: tetratricopeptide repeat protein [Planctomycetaceae bacterium]